MILEEKEEIPWVDVSGCAAMLSRVLGFVGSLRIADPCVSSKPFMRRIAVWTVGLPEKYWA